MKSLLYICEEWPNPYKPTWDFQIQALVDMGMEVCVVQCGDYASQMHLEWRASGESLGKVARFSYPSTLKDVPKHLHSAAFWWRIIARLRFLPLVARQRKPAKERLMDYLRICALPGLKYDYVLVKNLNCAADYVWLTHVVASRTKPTVYYHGGAVVGVAPLYLKQRDKIFANYELFLTNTQYSKSELESLGCPSSKVRAVPVGLRMDAPKTSRKVYRRDGVLRILSACRLSAEKGVIYAIQAIEQLVKSGVTNIKYDIVGNGFEEPHLRRYVQDNGLGAWIEFHGRRPNTEITERFMPQADVFLNTCYPTETWVETQCIAIQEAALARVPSIASNCGGIPEVIVDGKTGFLVGVKSLESISNAVRKMAGMDPTHIAQMGAAADEFARRNFDVQIVTRKLVNMMHDGADALLTENITSNEPVIGLTRR